MENTSQTSIEYLIMLAVVITIAAVAILLTGRVLTIKESVKSTLKAFRNKLLGIVD